MEILKIENTKKFIENNFDPQFRTLIINNIENNYSAIHDHIIFHIFSSFNNDTDTNRPPSIDPSYIKSVVSDFVFKNIEINNDNKQNEKNYSELVNKMISIDGYHCGVIKVPLKKYINDNKFIDFFNEKCLLFHKYSVVVNQFFNFYIMSIFNENDFSTINKFNRSFITNIIKLSFDLFSSKKSSNDKNIFPNKIVDSFKKINSFTGELFDSTNINQVIKYTVTSMITNIENNIRMNFFKYINRYINIYFKIIHDEELKKLDRQQKKINKKKYKSNLEKLKKDFKNKTNNSEGIYKQFLDENIKLFPSIKEKENYSSDISKNPYKYLYTMFQINKKIEENNGKMYQIIPIIRSIVKNNMVFDTKILIDFFSDNKNRDINEIGVEKSKEHIWGKVFKMNNRIFEPERNKKNEKNHKKYKNKHFGYFGSTDGVSLCLMFIDEKVKENKEKKTAGSKKAKMETKNMTEEEKKEHKKKKDINKKEELTEKIKKIKKETSSSLAVKKEEKEEHKEKQELIKILKNKIKELENIKGTNKTSKISKISEINKIKKNIEETKKLEKELFAKIDKKERINEEKEEFPYFDCITNETSNKIKNMKKIFIDPGKRDLLHIIDEENNIMTYSSKERMHNTKRLKNIKIIKKLKNEKNVICFDAKQNKEIQTNIKSMEASLSEINLKTCNIEKLKIAIGKKLEINNILYKTYDKEIFRKLRLNTYINTQKEDDRIIKKIKENYGEKIVVYIGDWSINKQMRNFISTPNKKIKNLLKKHFLVYNVDEYKTSKINCKTYKTNENLKIKMKNGKIKKLHSVLIYTIEQKRIGSNGDEIIIRTKGCINRDTNGVKNIREIVKHYYKTGERKEEFRRN